MRLAEALAERSDCQTRIEELRKRLSTSVRVQEGDRPAEDPASLLAEADRLFVRMLDLIQVINRTNSSTPFDATRTLSDAIVERDVIGKQRVFFSSTAETASTRQDRYSKSEVKFVATVAVSELQKTADRLAKQFRELDTKIQELNWKTDVV